MEERLRLTDYEKQLEQEAFVLRTHQSQVKFSEISIKYFQNN